MTDAEKVREPETRRPNAAVLIDMRQDASTLA
jgi:hypothetical protein